ncbi:CRP-like cAMP-binding protein [Dyadobacter jejuensis]|uniref:CRP-like cAMP-binding protein n=1 Tax=Dyadobacter jejuensis TaxID=1082580 RepID=A0A316A9M5_9BACT|nr:Crp/Fnr family transcriptional regulator [Dyadobacter jejuensis]PWJ54465.1 CRP-like cAMP-binding protein [Dyadobacter jejuensis]
MENLDDILKIDPDASVRFYKKKEFVQRKGGAKAYSFYVKKGLLRSYIIDSKGKEHVFMFASEGWIIADLEAIEFDEPTSLFIDCLEDSEILIFNKNCFLKADLSKEKIVEHLQLLYRRMAKLQRRVLMLMSSPAIDRYTHFVSAYPELPQRIPQHMIASYLGITPQALSTIRRKIAESK